MRVMLKKASPFSVRVISPFPARWKGQLMNRSLEEQTGACMEEHAMIPEGAHVMAAVSGGADSVCLLILLERWRRKKPFELEAIHVEHGIRGAESLEDARFVQELCGSLGVPLTIRHVNAPETARREKLSLEEAARACRYRAFEEAAQKHDSRVALAHHREDQAETVLFNLARGAGLAGMSGMRPVRGRYIRPLLTVGRGEIEAFLIQEGAAWREDATNTDLAFSRNVIRHRILPVLTASVNSRSIGHLCEAAQRASDAAEYLEAEAEAFCREYMHAGAGAEGSYAGAMAVTLPVRPLRRKARILREYILRRAVACARGGRGLKDVGAVHISDLDGLLFKPRGKHLDLPGRLKADRAGDTLVLQVTAETMYDKV